MKKGFIWFNTVGPCDGSQPTFLQAWWMNVPFVMTAMRVFLGADPPPAGARLDLNVQMYHHPSGECIDIVCADRYQPSSGIADVASWRAFQPPYWTFKPGEALKVIPYGLGPMTGIAPLRWGIHIVVEGHLLDG